MDYSLKIALLLSHGALFFAIVLCLMIILAQRKIISLVKSVASTDSLTGLRNHRTYELLVERVLRRTTFDGGNTALLVLDLNFFKRVNDKHGHLAGDQVIREAAHRMLVCVRPGDFVFRKGGDEFIVLLPNTDCGGAMQVAERIMATFASPFVTLAKDTVPLSVSIGIACISGELVKSLGEHSAEETLFSRADAAMYAAKCNKGTDKPTIAMHSTDT
ncbi:MAG: GGDEF domain-containing protein [bacterium]|nr:GGDEF domain-containing protein [bacterium]